MSWTDQHQTAETADDGQADATAEEADSTAEDGEESSEGEPAGGSIDGIGSCLEAGIGRAIDDESVSAV